MIYPITKAKIKECLQKSRAAGELALKEFLELESNKQLNFCINWSSINLGYVELVFEEEVNIGIAFVFDEGNCDKFNNYIRRKIVEYIEQSPDMESLRPFQIEVRSEW